MCQSIMGLTRCYKTAVFNILSVLINDQHVTSFIKISPITQAVVAPIIFISGAITQEIRGTNVSSGLQGRNPGTGVCGTKSLRS